MMRLTGILLLLGMSGCGTSAGIAEFKIYAETIDNIVAASEPVVDRLSVAERANALSLIDGDPDDPPVSAETVNGAQAGIPDRGVAPRFEVQHASYFAESGHPPFAGSVDTSLRALKRFNDALLIYADGKSLDAARDDLLAVGTNFTAAAAALQISIPAVSPALEVLTEGVAIFGQIGSREAFRTLLVSEGEKVDKLLEALINKSPLMFDFLAKADFDDRAIYPRSDPRFDAATKRILDTRTLVAEWVLLLQGARAALAASLAAANDEGTISSGIGDAALISSEISVRLERIRAILARKS